MPSQLPTLQKSTPPRVGIQELEARRREHTIYTYVQEQGELVPLFPYLIPHCQSVE